MGMCDTITCKYPLPNPSHQNLSYQTQDLECMMGYYTITEEGRLIQHVVEYESVPEEQRPYYGTPKWDNGGFYQLAGMLDAVPQGDEEIPFHGDIFISGKVSLDTFVTYRVRFTEGLVSSVTLVSGER